MSSDKNRISFGSMAAVYQESNTKIKTHIYNVLFSLVYCALFIYFAIIPTPQCYATYPQLQPVFSKEQMDPTLSYVDVTSDFKKIMWVGFGIYLGAALTSAGYFWSPSFTSRTDLG